MKRRIADERIQKDSHALLAVLCRVLLALQAAVLVIKVALGREPIAWALDAASLAAGLGVTVVLRSLRGLWRRGDEALREMDNAVLSTAYGTMLWVTLLGSLLMAFGEGTQLSWYAPCLALLLLTSLCYTVLAVKRGLILWGGAGARKDAKTRLRWSAALGALCYGAVMAAPDCFTQGAFQWRGLVKLVLMAAVWGGLFYALMVLLINRGEKAADKAAEEAEAIAEE